jgi:hypothetical protein
MIWMNDNELHHVVLHGVANKRMARLWCRLHFSRKKNSGLGPAIILLTHSIVTHSENIILRAKYKHVNP